MLTKSKIPSHFSVIKSGNETIFVKKGYDETVKNIVFNNRFSVNRQATNIDIKSGRGQYLSIPITKDSTEKIIIRDYKHGGLFGKFFGNVFLNFKRPLNEISISEFALQRGIPSAEVIAITQKRIFGIFYKATFVSKEIKGAIDILQFLKETPLEFIQKSKKSVIFALVRLIRNMHDAGIYHADLHLKNILLRKNLNGEFQAYIIDLDKSVI
ncbi:MAG TPA: lipopolysaccharide kinase InaA family protein, partial [Candidatus Wujingus californicus]